MEDGRSGSGHGELEQDENVPVLLRAKEIDKRVSVLSCFWIGFGLRARAFGVFVV